MSLIVGVTAASGFVASYCLLRAGMTAMWLRYPVAAAIAYLAFLVLLRLWMRARERDYAEGPDLVLADGPGAGGSSGYVGKGGESGGGGASGSYDEPAAPTVLDAESGSSIDDGMDAAAGAVADADDLVTPVIAVVSLALLALSSFWIIYAAPAFFAELLLDGVFAATLYRRLRGPASPHWLATAVRRTFAPFLVAATVAALAGWGMALYAPAAQSIGDVLLHAKGVR